MKSKPNSWRIMLGAVVGLVLGATTTGLMAQTNPPVGTWDCIISGPSQGIAYIAFAPDNTLTGYTLLSKVPKGAPNVDGRNGGATSGRDGLSFPTNGVTVSTNWFGILSVEGSWLTIGSGKVLGFLTESGYQLTSETNQTLVTNIVVVDTNAILSITTNTDVSYSTNYVTNAFSFTAKSSAKKIVMRTAGAQGNRVLNGKPATTVTNLSGDYYAIGTSNNVPFVEFLTLTPSLGYNAFDVAGTGAGYTFTGNLVESAQKRVGLVIYDGGSTIPRFSASGPVNTKKFTADLKGSDGNGSLIRYKIYKQP